MFTWLGLPRKIDLALTLTRWRLLPCEETDPMSTMGDGRTFAWLCFKLYYEF